jgi:Skp family chaperone for outer membrane proteins
VRNTRYLAGAVLVAVVAVSANQAGSSQANIGVVHLENALLKTREGQAAAKRLQTKAASRRQSLDALQAEITGLRTQLNKTAAVSTQNHQETLARELENKTKSFNRQVEDPAANRAC